MYVVAIIDETKCVGCRLCTQVCPEPNAIRFDVSKRKSYIVSIRCKGCQICEMSCPKKAISMKLALQKVT